VTAPAAAQGRISFDRERSLAVTMTLAPIDLRSPAVSGTGLVWRGRVLHPAAVPSIRVHVVMTGLPAGWRLVIRSEETGSIVEAYTPSPALMAAQGFWTGEIPGRAAFIDLELTAAGATVAVVVDRYAFDATPATRQAIHGIDGRLAIASASSRVRGLGRSVARLRIMIENVGQATCTGFLVSEVLLFTNEHCVASDTEARSTLVDLGYDQADTPTETIRAQRLVAVNHDLDYALLQLERAAPPQFARATLDPAHRLAVDEQLIVVEHPLGGYKQVSLESCEISELDMPGVTAARTDFGHKCDTLNGSSGSPVLDFDSGAVVGLHHFGFDLDTNTLVNRAVRIGPVLEDVRRQVPGITGIP
jgi:trypsin-like peptidase